MAPPIPDHSSATGAKRLADAINSYWAKEGYDARARVQETVMSGHKGHFTVHSVISDMVGGKPVHRLGSAA